MASATESSGAHGVVYACGVLTGGRMEPQETLQGRRVRGLFGARGQFVAVVDAWELDWQQRRDRSQVLEQETVTLHFQGGAKLKQVAFGMQHRVALSLDGQLFSWGARDATFGNGELGQVAGSWHAVTLTSRTTSASAARSATPVASKPPGEPEHDGIAGFDEREEAHSSSATAVCVPRRVHTGSELVFVKLACGAHHSVAVTDKGDVYAWGRNFEGQLGHGSTTLPSRVDRLQHGMCAWPKYVSALLGKPAAVDVSCGDNFTIVLLADGSIWRCGERTTGYTSHPQHKTDRTVRPLIACGSDGALFTSIAAGYAHALGLTTSGELFAWGLNSYGQLGLGTSHKNSSTGVPTALPHKCKWVSVYAGGHYSAAIAGDGQLFTWGNGHYGQLGHGFAPREALCEFAPRAVDSLRGKRVSQVVCDQKNLFAFAPTVVTAIAPRAGELGGGYEIRISGSGFWSSEDLTVRFAPRTEARLPRGALACYDEATREVVCIMPKFSLAGEFAVEVAMDGKHFTSNGHVFEAFKRPLVVAVSRWDVRLCGGDEIVVTLDGELPRCCNGPLLRFVAVDNPEERVQVAGAIVETLASPPLTHSPRSELPQATTTALLKFLSPVFSRCDVLCCYLELSYNDGFIFTPLHCVPAATLVSHSASASAPETGGLSSTATQKPFVLQCHDACVTRLRPNSFLVRSLPSTLDIDVRHLLTPISSNSSSRRKKDENQWRELTVRLEITQLSVSDAAADCHVDVELPVVSVTQHSQIQDATIACSVPPLTSWKLSKIDAKTRERVVVATDWWKFVPRWGFEASVRVSMNGNRCVLPAVSPTQGGVVCGVFQLGKLLHASPVATPLSGGTLVSVAADYWNFDTEDAVVLLKWKEREVCVPARCVVPAGAESGGSFSAASTSLRRRLLFTTPALPFPPAPVSPPTPNARLPEDGTTTVVPAPAADDVAEISLGLSEDVELFVSLDGVAFQRESSLRLTYVRVPELLEISPFEAEPGTRMMVKADKVAPPLAGMAWVRLTTVTRGVSMVVAAEVIESTSMVEFELPQLLIADDDVVRVAFSLDGQQFTTTETEAAVTTSFRYRAATRVGDEAV